MHSAIRADRSWARPAQGLPHRLRVDQAQVSDSSTAVCRDPTRLPSLSVADESASARGSTVVPAAERGLVATTLAAAGCSVAPNSATIGGDEHHHLQQSTRTS
jgi:hypothetical protein